MTSPSGTNADDFEFVGDAGDLITASVTSGVGLDGALYLLNGACEVVAEDNGAGQILAELPARDVYVVVVTSASPGQTGSYTVSLQEGYPPGETCLATDNLLNTSGSTSSSLGVGDPTDGPRGAGYHYEDFEFSSRANRRLSWTVGTDAFTPYTYLLDQDCRVIAEDGPSRALFVLPSTGTYTLVVTSASAGETGAFSIEADLD